jgi:hypothetical protein
MMQDILDQGYRKKVINEIKSDENVQRKIVSYKKQNMQNDNFYQYVVEYLESKLDAETVSELNVFANINLQKRISKSESSIYKRGPERKFFIDENEIEELNSIYDDMDIDTCLRRANEAYKYQDQCSIQIYPEDGCLKSRVLLPHHFDVIPMEHNPEKAYAYIISNFDNTSRDKIRRDDNRTGFSQGDKYRDQLNQEIGDYDDSQLDKERYFVWTSEHNFVMDGRGRILDKETYEPITEADEYDQNIISPLADFDCLPFIDISAPKDFEYWVRSGDSLYDATIMYNVIITSEFQTVEMQGHAQPWYKGDAEHMPENIRIGVDKLIHIPINPQNPVPAEFGFANPGSDLGGIREFRESYLAAFLSSRGLDTSIISGQSSVSTASSGVEKMLQMVEKFEASLEDFSLFKNVEQQIVKIVSSWITSLRGERVDGGLTLKDKYQINIPDPKAVEVSVEYAKPEMVKTEMEVLEVLEKEIEIGVSSRVHYLMENKGMSEEQAIEYVTKVDEYERLTMGGKVETNTEENEGVADI